MISANALKEWADWHLVLVALMMIAYGFRLWLGTREPADVLRQFRARLNRKHDAWKNACYLDDARRIVHDCIEDEFMTTYGVSDTERSSFLFAMYRARFHAPSDRR